MNCGYSNENRKKQTNRFEDYIQETIPPQRERPLMAWLHLVTRPDLILCFPRLKLENE